MLRVSSPHAHRGGDTGQVMRLVAFATLPGMAALTWFFGLGVIHNVLLASLSCIAFEALILKLRGRPLGFYLRDCSALVTGVLLGLALPAYCPWWLVVIGSATAIILAKQLYGGLGFNPFNPAMVGYVVLLISFPVEMTQWPAPAGIAEHTPSLGQALAKIWLGTPIDGYTAATPLDVMKQNTSLLVSDLYQTNPGLSAGTMASLGWEWGNLGFLLGGLFLL